MPHLGRSSAALHPVSGPGEDRTPTTPPCLTRRMWRCTRSPDRVRIAPTRRSCGPTWPRALHPVSGPGEDRNPWEDQSEIECYPALHPVSGPGEDRNGGQKRETKSVV